VQKVNAEVVNALALLLDVSVTQMFAEIAGLGNEFHIFDAILHRRWINFILLIGLPLFMKASYFFYFLVSFLFVYNFFCL
jgi:hypothetical protein